MNIIVKKVGEEPIVKEIEKLELNDMQDMVGGLIECLHVGNGVDMWLNDCGKIWDMPINVLLGVEEPERQIIDSIHGDIFFASGTDEGETVGLTDEQVGYVMRKFDDGNFCIVKHKNNLDLVPVWVYA